MTVIYTRLIAVVMLGLLTSCASVHPEKSNFHLRFFGDCGVLYDGDNVVTKYWRKSGKTASYVIGKDCKKSHPYSDRMSMSLFDTIEPKGFYVRAEKKEKNGSVRRVMIRKELGQYVTLGVEWL